MNKDAKIYVAGHKGLVGSAIWRTLVNKGYTNLIGRTSNELDLRDSSAVDNYFKTEKPEYVFLAAAKVGGIMANNTYRGQFIYENLMIQNNVIHASYINKVNKLLFLGSTCIYPKGAPQPMIEDSLLTGTLEYTNEPYAIAKIAGIKMCESYNIQYGTNFISVMPTNLYGPNDNFDLEKSHVLPALLRKIHIGKCIQESNWDEVRNDLNKRPVEGVNGRASLKEIVDILSKYGINLIENKNQKNSSDYSKANTDTKRINIEIWGSGSPMREFLWSEEMADACVFIMENTNFSDLLKKDQNEIRNKHINIGTGEEISIKHLAYLIKKVVGFKGDFIFNTNKPDGTLRKLTDVSKLHSLGWHHKIEIEDGIYKFYNWYIKNN